MNRLAKSIFLVLGIVSLGLGLAGLVLPVLPATPFLLLAALALGKSSDRLSRWMRSKPFIAKRLDSIAAGEGLATRDKVGIFALATALIMPLIILSSSLHLRLFLAGLLGAKAIFFILWNPGKSRGRTEAASLGEGSRQSPDPRPWVLGVLGMVQSLGNVVLYALLARVLVDRGLRLDPWFWAGLGALGLKLAAAYANRVLMPRTSRRERLSLRREVLKAAWALGDRRGAPDHGAIVSLATEGVESLTLYRGLYVPQLMVGIGAPFLIVGAMALADPVTASVLLALIPLTPLLVGGLQARFRKASATYREVNGRLINRYEEGLLGLTTLKTAGHSKEWGAKIAEAAREHRRAALGLLVVNQLLILFLDLSASLGLTFVAAWLSWSRLGSGEASPFAALFITLASLELIRPQQLMGAFFFAGGLGRNSLKAAKGLKVEAGADDVALNTVFTPVSPGSDAPATARELLARDLAYHYPGSPDQGALAFRFPSPIHLRPGTLVGLLGSSGSGKTTLRRLLAGLLQAKAGRIEVDEQDLTESPGALRALVAVADQSPYLFTGTVGENLRYARPGASNDELWSVIRAVGLESMPAIRAQGLDAPVGEEGRLLSGGQRSRLSLARALLRDCPFLILDEPSADLDPHTEALVLHLAQDLSRHKGVLVISHRPALLAGVDEKLEMPTLEEAWIR